MICLNHGFEVNGWVQTPGRGWLRGFIRPGLTTTLIEACRFGEVENVERLISLGADVNLPYPDSSREIPLRTIQGQIFPLFTSLISWRVPSLILQTLINHGADLHHELFTIVSMRIEVEHRSLYTFWKISNLSPTLFWQVDVQNILSEGLKFLLARGARSQKALFLAMKYGHIHVLKRLLNHGHSKDSKMIHIEWGEASLAEYGLKYGQSEAVEWLDSYVPRRKTLVVDELTESENRTIDFGQEESEWTSDNE